MDPVFFERPDAPATILDVAPRLASWNKADHPDQIELAKALHAAEEQLRAAALDVAEPLALRLDVGLPADVPLLDQRDLDNYAYPLASHLTKVWKRPLRSVWATKSAATSSLIRCTTAIVTPASGSYATIETTASSDTIAYKEQIADQLTNDPLPDGPVALELAFVVGPTRNWLNLWKPTIDALGKLLGSSGARDWHPQDGRITELGLHCAVDHDLGTHVIIGVAARSSA